MVKVAAAAAALLPLVTAWPTAMKVDELIKRAGTGRINTGAGHPVVTFSEDQLVDVSAGSGNEFVAPLSTDKRGQCPGLNAAANHGFLPHNGIATITQTITGLGAAYNMGADLAGFLAAVSVLLSGDIPTGRWSIGGSFPGTLSGVLTTPDGILGTHNEYEGDASIVRGDAYLNGGNVDVFQMRSWNHLYGLVGTNLNLDKAASQSNYVTQYSVNNNKYYFSGPFSGLVAPAAHNFVVNFFSNHTAANPGGYLDDNILKSFFAVTGTSAGNFVHHQYQERIPYNWYKRPGGASDYNAVDVFLDLIAGATIYPNTIKIGGNTGTVNSFTGADLGNLTGGVFNAATLLQGNNLACFAYQAAEGLRVQQLQGVAGITASALTSLTNQIKAPFAGLSCPQVAKFDDSALKKFPGYTKT